MAIEFHCPNGHILEVDDEHAGKQIRCPACDVRCLVPPSGAAATIQPPAAPAEESVPIISSRKIRKPSRKRGVASRRQPLDVSVPEVSDQPVIEQPVAAGVQLGVGIGAANRKRLHIQCKQCSQLLEVTNEMLGDDLACPACSYVFKAELKRTVEFRHEKKIKEDREERMMSKRWLTIAVFTGLTVLAGLLAMIIWSASR